VSAPTQAKPGGHLGLWSGVGLVTANMIGAGVFLSAGYMAQDLTPGQLLLNWLVGAGIALLGVASYSAVARLVPRSGGEYRYLHDLMHPALGYLAGWASFLVGFSAPIAVNALAAGAFARTLFPGLEPTVTAAVLVVALTAVHAAGLSPSRWTQDTLAWLKLVLVAGFVGVGLFLGRGAWPSWQPPGGTGEFPWQAFAVSLFYVGFAFSGWNSAIYAASDFRDPKRDVPRSMWIGCALVAVLYLLVNWVFVANLTPTQAIAVTQYETAQVTLGHLVASDLLGARGGALMSGLAVVAFVSAMSAMVYVGPRVYAAMAADGFLPRVLQGREGRPPVGSVLLQGALALALVFTHQLKQVLQNVGAVLMLFAALTALALFKVRFSRAAAERPGPGSLVAAALFVAVAGGMLYFGFCNSPELLGWVGAVAVAALVAYLLTRRLGRKGG
jgi:APA family basic amino acid/polyamine antiporter